eukprot:TRINITY_DN29255_c0_g1_i2.p1 TRINITY_DN29255_c0_g1~~TRINITY_DN29255_c0_g1_i2.p1  ORF type:complete len:536 (-),score=153.00 TRINITY_DN29255_c0_g1_i2:28-1635(-)
MGNAALQATLENCPRCSEPEEQGDVRALFVEAEEKVPKELPPPPVEEPQEPQKPPRKWVLPSGGKLTVMMFGMTGAGKSSLGNLIADGLVFDSSDDTASVTNLDSIMKFEADDASLILLDTIGLGDTEIDQEKVVASIRDVALSAPNGVDCLLYVMRNERITDDAISRLIYVTEYLWGSESLLNLYIVVTCASRYMKNRKDAEEWIQRQVEINWRFKHIYTIVGKNPSRFLFVDNPAPDCGELEVEERREQSHQVIFKALCKHPRDAVPPFTQAMMKKVQELTKTERLELDAKEKEVQRLQQEIKNKQKGKKKGKKSEVELKSEDIDEGLYDLMKKAKEDMQQAKKAMNMKLAQVKADKGFQEQVREQAELATLRFSQDYEDDAAAAGQSQKDPEKVKAGRSLIGALGRSLLGAVKKTVNMGGGKRSSKTNVKVSAESAAAASGLSPEEEAKAILASVRKSSKGESPAQIFASLGGWNGAGALSPMVFAKFLLNAAPGTKPTSVGNLWWKADTNGDGQVDIEEFKDFFKNHVDTA